MGERAGDVVRASRRSVQIVRVPREPGRQRVSPRIRQAQRSVPGEWGQAGGFGGREAHPGQDLGRGQGHLEAAQAGHQRQPGTVAGWGIF